MTQPSSSRLVTEAANATVSAADRARGNHTGTQTADTITDGTTNKAYTAAEKTKLAGVTTGATANRADSAVDTLLAAKADLVSGLVPTSQIPALALNTSVTVASQAAMLALTTTQVQPGDLAIRTDGAGTFILTASDPTQLANWTRLNAPTDAVTTVNGQQGTVVLAKADVGLPNVDNTSDVNKPVSTAQAAAIAAGLFGGTVNAITANATAVAGVRNTVDATAAPVTVTLPTPTFKGQPLIITRLDATNVNAITIAGTINGVGAATATLPAVGASGEGALWIAESLTSWTPAGSIKPKAWLDALYDAKGAGVSNSDPSAQQLAADGVSLASPWQQSALKSMRPPTKVISRFQSGHGWTSGADDLTTKLFTDRSYKVTTNGTGSNKYMTSPTFTAIDMSTSSIRIIFKVDDATKFGGLYLQAITSAGNQYGSGNLPGDMVVSGEWTVVTIPRAFFGVGSGTPTWSSITAFNVAAFDKSAGACTVNLAAVELVPDLASTYPNGVMIVEFDDGYIGQKTYGAPVLGQRGIPATYNVIGDRFVGGSPSSGMTVADLLAFQDRWGWAIGCHAYASAAHGAATEADFQRQKQWLHANGLHSGAEHFAQSPGAGSPAGIAEASLMGSIRRTFKSVRLNAGTVETALPADALRIRSRLFTGETNAQLQTLIAQVAGAGGAFVLTFHDVIAGATNGTSNGLAAIGATNLATTLDYAAGLGMVFRTRPEWIEGR